MVSELSENTRKEDVENGGRINIIGLPNSGKTTYFCVCMDLMQRQFNDLNDGYSIIFETSITDQMVRDVISGLRDNQSWPSNTRENIEYKVSMWHDDKKREFCFMDHSGESFIEMYEDAKLEPAENVQNANLIKASDTAGGDIIFIIESTSLIDKENKVLSKCLFNLFRELEEAGFHGKLAIVATQGDRLITNFFNRFDRKALKKMFGTYDNLTKKDINNKTMEVLFKEQQPNSYARLKKMRCEYKFFLVTAVDCKIDVEDNYIPPENYSPERHSTNVCDPLFWLMGFDPAKITANEMIAKQGSYDDDLLAEAAETVLATGVASARALQRRLPVSFSRASRLIDMMEQLEIVGPGDEVRQREILADKDTAKEILEKAGCVGKE